MLEIKYTKTAFNDLDKIFKLIFEDKKNVAIEYINKLRKYIKLLEENPYMGVDCKNKNINKKCRIIIFESYNIYYSIEKDYIKMFGKRMANDQMKYMYDDSETFIFAFRNALCEFSVRVRNSLMKKYWEELSLYEYYGLIKSGMFWEFFPNLSGDYLQDKEFFINFIAERENKKEYFTLISSK